MYAQFQDWLSHLDANYFDVAVGVALLLGLLRGRKNGMSQELLPMLRWLALVGLAGYFHPQVSQFLRDNVSNSIGALWGNRIGYFSIALAVLLVFAAFDKMFGEKLSGSDAFGKGEFYWGMFAGVVRMACIVVALLALMNSHVVNQAELNAAEAERKKNPDDVHFPSYGMIQHAIFFHSLTGRNVRVYLSPILIASVAIEPKKPSLANQNEELIKQVLQVTRSTNTSTNLP